ncbi:MAG: DNA repair protein RecO, partial [Candidatus Levybacteria bacterium CG_4_10_14_0_2_um_filter_35_8]
MNSYKTEGIVIKRRNLGEADKILTIFTKRYGKIQVKAPGIRKINSRRSPHVELLNYSAI